MRRVLVALAILLLLLVLLGTAAWFMTGPGAAPPELRGTEGTVVAGEERAPRDRIERGTGGSVHGEQPAAPAPTGVIPPPTEYKYARVSVLDGNGAVVEGALIQVVALQTRLALAGEPVALTDAAGGARVRIWTGEGMFRVLALRGDERVQSQILFPPEEGDLVIELRLEPAVTVRGQVVDVAGRGMPHVQVILRTSNVTTDTFKHWARCDVRGKFQFASIAASVVADGATIQAFPAPVTAPLTERFDALTLRSGAIVLRAPPGVRAVGRVLTAAGEPAVGASVQLDGGVYATKTGVDGRFEFAFVTPAHARVIVLPAVDLGVAVADLPEPQDGVRDAGDIVVARGRSLTIRARADKSLPAPTGTVVHVVQAGLTVRATVTTGDGVAVLHGLGPGPFDIAALGVFFTVEPGSRASVAWGQPLRLGVARDVTPDDEGIEIVMRAGRSIALRFVDAVTRRPLQPPRGVLSLRVKRPRYSGRVHHWPDPFNPGTGYPPFVAADFTGPHELMVTAVGYHPAAVHHFEIHDDRVTEVEVPLRPR